MLKTCFRRTLTHFTRTLPGIFDGLCCIVFIIGGLFISRLYAAVRLPSGRLLSPAGQCVSTPNFTISVVGSGRNVIVAASGASSVHSLDVFQADTLQARSRLLFYKQKPWWSNAIKGVNHQSLFQGMAAGPDGKIYVAGGYSDNILVLQLNHGQLHLLRRIALHGQAFPADEYPYQYQGTHKGSPLFYPDSVAVGPKGKHVFTSGLLSNSVAAINLGTGHIRYANTGPFPFQVVLADHGRRLAVSNWGGNSVTVLDSRSLKVLGRIALGPHTGPGNRRPGVHPTAMVAVGNSSRVWVACANTDVLVKVDVKTIRALGIAVDLPYAGAAPGTFPDALAIDRDMLFAANSGNNDIAIFNAQTGKPLGLVPTAWYPTSLTIHGQSLFVSSAKGMGSGPDMGHQWIGDSMNGSLEQIPLAGISTHFAAWTHRALVNNGFTSGQRALRHKQNTAVEIFLHRHIHHVVFILRENKTFDEDFGAYHRAGKWADPQLDLYNQRELPNLYKLARHYALCVNFYVDGEVTAQGHQWTTSAEDSDYVQRTWPMYYSGRGLMPAPGWTQSLGGNADKNGYGLSSADNPYSATENLSALGHWSNPWISYPQGMFLFNDLLAHHKSFMDFGEFVSRNEAGDISTAMHRHIAMKAAGWNLFILDTSRATVVRKYIVKHRKKFPQLMYIWLPDDHTAGRTPGYYTPAYYVANNDYATGRIVAALSRARAWRHTLVIITEDDAQSGADHIDAHRSFTLLVSPWIKPGSLVTRHYSQIDLMRTIEAVCKIPPMSQWDSNARVISGIWTGKPTPTPFTPLAIRVPKAFNPGRIFRETRLRQKAGKTGHWLSPQWLKAHGLSGEFPQHSGDFTPTTLEKIPGPEQMRQEWIATKGRAGYEKVMTYIQALARRQHRSLSAYIATADDDGN